jgi:hypothetical protein
MANTKVWTATELATRLGTQMHRLRCWEQQGRIPARAIHPGHGRPTWTDDEADTIEKWHENYIQAKAGCA